MYVHIQLGRNFVYVPSHRVSSLLYVNLDWLHKLPTRQAQQFQEYRISNSFVLSCISNVDFKRNSYTNNAAGKRKQVRKLEASEKQC